MSDSEALNAAMQALKEACKIKDSPECTEAGKRVTELSIGAAASNQDWQKNIPQRIPIPTPNGTLEEREDALKAAGVPAPQRPQNVPTPISHGEDVTAEDVAPLCFNGKCVTPRTAQDLNFTR